MASDHLVDFFNYLSIEKGLSKNTISSYRRDLQKYFEYLSINSQNFASIQAEDLNQYVAWLRGKASVNKLGESSIARNVIAVRNYYKYLSKEHGNKDIASNFHPPKIPKRLPKALSIDQITKILSIAGEDLISVRDRALLEILYSTGARVTEVINLDISDISSTKNKEQEITTIKLKGKGGKERVVPLGSFGLSAINDYLTRSRPTQKALFLNQRGGRFTRQSAWNVVAARSARAGLKGEVTPHSLRHSFATHLLDGGADIRVVQELLGHSSVTTTQIYTLITIDRLRESYSSAHPRSK